MKAILVTFDQAHYNKIIDALQRSNCRGFTAWEHVLGQGTVSGEPHFGTHAWPSMASAIISIVEDQRVDEVLGKLRAIDLDRPKLGLRAFVWAIESAI